MDNVSDFCPPMAVVDPDEGGVVFDETDVSKEVENLSLCLVGRFMTDKAIHFLSMQNTLASIWKPVKCMFFRDLGSSSFLFQFFHEKDVLRVEKGGRGLLIDISCYQGGLNHRKNQRLFRFMSFLYGFRFMNFQ